MLSKLIVADLALPHVWIYCVAVVLGKAMVSTYKSKKGFASTATDAKRNSEFLGPTSRN